jgi:hypothetical protein
MMALERRKERDRSASSRSERSECRGGRQEDEQVVAESDPSRDVDDVLRAVPKMRKELCRSGCRKPDEILERNGKGKEEEASAVETKEADSVETEEEVGTYGDDDVPDRVKR